MKEKLKPCPFCQRRIVSPIEQLTNRCFVCIKKTFDTKNQLEILLLFAKPLVSLQADCDELLFESRHLCDLIHEDIFYKEPRGQVEEGQEIRWHRCSNILEAKDRLVHIIEKLGTGGQNDISRRNKRR